ncbi:MAG: PAS domain-containing protein, partial [Bacteroidetes bacterium]|nr:PAS domain-containing protein [Bacteroidota bacterium]
MPLDMIRKKKIPTIDKLGLSNPQRAAVARMIAAVKNKYKKLLHDAHERMHIIADLTSSIEFWYNVNGKYEYVSPYCTVVLGYEPVEFMRDGLRLESIVHEDDLERFRADRARAFDGESGSDVEYRVYAKDKTIHYMLLSWNPVLTRKGKHIGIRISLRDISDYRRCRHFAQAYEQLTHEIADELPHTGIISLAPDLLISNWSKTAVRLFGWSREEAIGNTLPGLFGKETDTLLEGLDVLECTGRFSTNLLIHAKDGKQLAVRVVALVLCDVEHTLHQYTFLVYPIA